MLGNMPFRFMDDRRLKQTLLGEFCSNDGSKEKVSLCFPSLRKELLYSSVVHCPSIGKEGSLE